MSEDIQTQEFSGDEVEVVAHRSPDCQIKFEITLSPEATVKAYKNAIKQVKKEISVPGFRKGRAPDQLVKDSFSQDIEKNWKQNILEAAADKTFELTDIYPVNKDSFHKVFVKDHSKEEGSHITLEFEHLPEIPEFTEQLRIEEKRAAEIEDKQIDEFIEKLRKEHPRWEEAPEDKVIEDGDAINLDIEELGDTPKTLCEDFRLTTNKEQLPPWLYPLVLGKRKGDVFEGMEEGPKKENEGDSEQEPPKFKVTVRGIFLEKLPDVDEDFTKELGIDSIEELRDRIRQQEQRLADQSAHQETLENIQKQILSTYHFELPKSLIEEELAQRSKTTLRNMKKEGLSDEEILTKEAEIQKKINEEVQRDLKIFFIARKLENEEKISVGKDEIEKNVNAWLSAFAMGGQNLDITKDEEMQTRFFHMAYHELLTRKTKEYFLEQAEKI